MAHKTFSSGFFFPTLLRENTEHSISCSRGARRLPLRFAGEGGLARHRLLPVKRQPSLATTLDRVLFVVMCSYDKKERVSWLSQTWLAWIPPRNVVLLRGVEALTGLFFLTARK